jgi:hypothetical protein
MRTYKAVVTVGLVLVVAAACAAAPVPASLTEGDCYTLPSGAFGDLSMRYDGPANSLDNASIFEDTTCTVPHSLLTNSTVAIAPHQASAVAECTAIDGSFGDAENLAATGWLLVSGAGVPGSLIDANAWGCSV